MTHVRITRSKSVTDKQESGNKNQNNMLEEISTKLTVVCDRLSEVTTQLLNLNKTMDYLSKDMQQDASLRDVTNVLEGSICSMKIDLCREVQTLSKEIHNISDVNLNSKDTNKLPNTHTEEIETVVADTDATQPENDVENAVQSIKDWDIQLNKRKMLFWDSLRCQNTAQQYKRWLEEEPKFIPRKFLSKSFEGELKEEKQARRKLAEFKMETDIKVLESRHKDYREKYQQIDLTMDEEIGRIKPKQISTDVNTKWIAAYTHEEEISHSRWKNSNRKFLASLPDTEQEHKKNVKNTAPNHRHQTNGHRYGKYNQNNSPYHKTDHSAEYSTAPSHQVKKSHLTHLHKGNAQRTTPNHTVRQPFLWQNQYQTNPH